MHQASHHRAVVQLPRAVGAVRAGASPALVKRCFKRHEAACAPCCGRIHEAEVDGRDEALYSLHVTVEHNPLLALALPPASQPLPVERVLQRGDLPGSVDQVVDGVAVREAFHLGGSPIANRYV
jgi:hypothetical protein